MPYARGTLRLQHVTFFNWCEPPVGASLSVSMGLISPERRKVFPLPRRSLRYPVRDVVIPWLLGPGLASHRGLVLLSAPRPCAVPCGRLAAGSRLAPSPRRAGSCRLRPLRWWFWVPGPVPARPHWATGRVFRAFWPSGAYCRVWSRNGGSTGLSGQSDGAGPGSAYAERGPKGDERGRECAGRSRPWHQHRRALSSGPCAGVRASCPSRSASRRRA